MARGDAPQPAARRTVLVALAANASIAVAKLVAGLASGSSALLAEFAHSVADTMNQVFLLYSLATGEREPDAEHPFGYGKERFFWSFLAAVGIFVAGAGFSFYEGLSRIFGPETESGSYGIAYAVLAFAVLAEGASLMRAYRQTRDEAAESRQSHARYVRASRDPTTKTVLFEDSAAVIGVVVAFAGVALHQATGNQLYDGLASVVIAVLLATVAVALGRDTKALLIGEAASPEEREAIQEIIEAHPAVDRLLELLTMALAPDRLLVAARIDLADGLSADEIERASSELDRELHERIGTVWQVFLDATPRSEVGQASGDRRPARGA
ncbi:MAG TPA: cation diffusion facilitator family transporter [Solirubrobacteraceae bacterium]